MASARLARLSLICSLLVGCAKSTPPSKAHVVLAPALSASASASAMGPPAPSCEDAQVPLRWLGSASPDLKAAHPDNTPLALGAASMRSAGVACCAAWTAP